MVMKSKDLAAAKARGFLTGDDVKVLKARAGERRVCVTCGRQFRTPTQTGTRMFGCGCCALVSTREEPPREIRKGDRVTMIWLGEAGLNAKQIAAVTGHQSRAMVDHYTHDTKKTAQKAVESLPELRATGTDDTPAYLLLAQTCADDGKTMRSSAQQSRVSNDKRRWGGRAAECAGLENRYPP